MTPDFLRAIVKIKMEKWTKEKCLENSKKKLFPTTAFIPNKLSLRCASEIQAFLDMLKTQNFYLLCTKKLLRKIKEQINKQKDMWSKI